MKNEEHSDRIDELIEHLEDVIIVHRDGSAELGGAYDILEEFAREMRREERDQTVVDFIKAVNVLNLQGFNL